jgi:hypothetical protein
MTYTRQLKLTYKMKSPQKPIEASAGMADFQVSTSPLTQGACVPYRPVSVAWL